MIKVTSKHVSARIDPELRDAMQNWALRNSVPISWVLKRSIEIGFPQFLKKPLRGKCKAKEAGA